MALVPCGKGKSVRIYRSSLQMQAIQAHVSDPQPSHFDTKYHACFC